MNKVPINEYIKNHESSILPNYARLVKFTTPNKKLSIVDECHTSYEDGVYFGYHSKNKSRVPKKLLGRAIIKLSQNYGIRVELDNHDSAYQKINYRRWNNLARHRIAYRNTDCQLDYQES